MNQLLSRIPLYVSHFLRRVDEHSVQAPFAFHFVSDVVKGKTDADFSKIEEYRKRFEKSSEEISYSTFGQPSNLSLKSRKKIADIARSGISSQKKSELFHRIIKMYELNTIIELGTSLGINTCYLAEAVPGGKVITFEGHEELASLAKQTFSDLKYKNIDLIYGDIDDGLPKMVREIRQIDFVFIDANHRSDALFRYFETFLPYLHEKSVLIVDDIRWSRDMFEGWKGLIKHQNVSHIFEFENFGVLFFHKKRMPQHLLLHF